MRAMYLLFVTMLATTFTTMTGQYKVLQTAAVGGEGGYDYVAADAAGRKLYVARSGAAGALYVYNLDTLEQVGRMATGSAHGAAIDSATHHGFATSRPVTMFDSEKLTILKTIDTGGSPDGYLDDPATHQVYILSHVAPNLTVLDAITGSIVTTVDLGGAPEQAVVDKHGHLFVDLEDKAAIAVVDTLTFKVTGRYDISSHGGGCAGLAIDTAHGVLFATCREKSNMIILDAKDGKVLADLPTGRGSDGAVFLAATNEVFSAQEDGTLTIVKETSPTSFVMEQTLKTAPHARTLTLDTNTGRIFLPTAEFGPLPEAVAGQRAPRPPMIADSFSILVVGK